MAPVQTSIQNIVSGHDLGPCPNYLQLFDDIPIILLEYELCGNVDMQHRISMCTVDFSIMYYCGIFSALLSMPLLTHIFSILFRSVEIRLLGRKSGVRLGF